MSDDAPKVVFKYPLAFPVTELLMPAGAAVLTVQLQRGVPILWALVDQQAPATRRVIMAVPTGGQSWFTDGWRYIATVQLPSSLVFHFFEVPASA